MKIFGHKNLIFKGLCCYLLFLLTLNSCSLSSNGKIEFRDGTICKDTDSNIKSVYLINTSNSKKVAFTVKKVVSYACNEKEPKDITTQIYTLAPGEETYIGCTGWSKGSINWGTPCPYIYDYEVVGATEGK